VQVKKMKHSAKQYDAIFATGIATIGIQLDGTKLAKVDYLKRRKNKQPKTKPAESIQNKIERYLGSKTKDLKIEVLLDVSPFQGRVLTQLMQIPYGETRTYGEIAKKLNTSPRAVGNACRHNPIPIIIPCHRVIAANGIGGYDGATAGATLDIKHRLLQLEGII
jgi:methylated-DNA-[protein]-cysteine S-methyltransferase